MGGKFKYQIFIGLLSILFLVQVAYAAPPTVISNSKDWKDVYSANVYANLNGYANYFLTSSGYGRIVLNMVNKETEKVIIVNSNSQAFISNYDSIVTSVGLDFENINSNNINLELARRLTDINSFIIIDDAYGYNAISAAPYAAVSRSYVIFANSGNIGQVVNFLNTKSSPKIISYGQVSREVKDELAVFNPEIINEGDRFDDNLRLVDKYLQLKPRQQVILTNGEFIESSLMSGEDPVIFIGRANVPDVVREYITKSDFKVAILIGNELIGPAQSIRRQIGISVFVKFAQGARTPAGAVSTVEDLDRFALPRYILSIDVFQVVYNQISRQLEITYRNRVAQAAYLLPTITIRTGDSEILADPTEDGIIFLEGNGYKTVLYDVNLTNEDLVDALAQIYILYGEGRRSLEFVYENSSKISSLSIMDNSVIEVQSLVFDKFNKRFIAKIKNTGEVDAYVNVELSDIMINGERVNLGAGKTIFIEAGKTVDVQIAAPDFKDEDVADNPMVTVRAYYGERERSLYKTSITEFQFEYATGMIIVYVIVGVIVLLFIIFELTRKKCKNCKHKNPFWKKKCVKCGNELK